MNPEEIRKNMDSQEDRIAQYQDMGRLSSFELEMLVIERVKAYALLNIAETLGELIPSGIDEAVKIWGTGESK